LVKPSTIDFDIENQHVILVDDVLQTGRTIRAAMNEIFDFGRPKSILLATLIERNGRQLPIEPSIVGLQPPLEKDEHIRLEGPSPLTLTVNKSKKRRTEKPTN
jgi:pyrimidine operon attenuation protein/uracil phosphoribosyltransferase